eukprot:6222158-Prymnesium_polylepis.1
MSPLGPGPVSGTLSNDDAPYPDPTSPPRSLRTPGGQTDKLSEDVPKMRELLRQDMAVWVRGHTRNMPGLVWPHPSPLQSPTNCAATPRRAVTPPAQPRGSVSP